MLVTGYRGQGHGGQGVFQFHMVRWRGAKQHAAVGARCCIVMHKILQFGRARCNRGAFTR